MFISQNLIHWEIRHLQHYKANTTLCLFESKLPTFQYYDGMLDPLLLDQLLDPFQGFTDRFDLYICESQVKHLPCLAQADNRAKYKHQCHHHSSSKFEETQPSNHRLDDHQHQRYMVYFPIYKHHFGYE